MSCGRSLLHGITPPSSGLSAPGPGFLAWPMHRCPNGGLRGRSSLFKPQVCTSAALFPLPPPHLPHAPLVHLHRRHLYLILALAALLLYGVRGLPYLRPATQRHGTPSPLLHLWSGATSPLLPLPLPPCSIQSLTSPAASQPMAWAHRAEGGATASRFHPSQTRPRGAASRGRYNCASGLPPSRSAGRMLRPQVRQEPALDQDEHRDTCPAPRTTSPRAPCCRGRLRLEQLPPPMKSTQPMAWARRVGGGATSGRFQSSQPPPRRAASRGRYNCASGLPPPRSAGRMLRPQSHSSPAPTAPT